MASGSDYDDDHPSYAAPTMPSRFERIIANTWFTGPATLIAFVLVLVLGSYVVFAGDAWFAYVMHWDWHHGYADWRPEPFKPLPPPPAHHAEHP